MVENHILQVLVLRTDYLVVDQLDVANTSRLDQNASRPCKSSGVKPSAKYSGPKWENIPRICFFIWIFAYEFGEVSGARRAKSKTVRA